MADLPSLTEEQREALRRFSEAPSALLKAALPSEVLSELVPTIAGLALTVDTVMVENAKLRAALFKAVAGLRVYGRHTDDGNEACYGKFTRDSGKAGCCCGFQATVDEVDACFTEAVEKVKANG